jgi:hypothetical protein
MPDLFTGQPTSLNRQEVAKRLDEIIAHLGKDCLETRDIKVARRLLEQLYRRIAP